MEPLQKAGDSLLIRLLALMLLLCVLPVQQIRVPTSLWDLDIWWHVRVGDWIRQHHSVPHTAIFSQLSGARPWLAYSWGFEVVVSTLHRWLGLKALPIFVIVFGIAFTLLLFAILQSLSRSFWWSWSLTLVAIWSANLNLVDVGRPASFSIAFFAIELWLIFRARQAGKRTYLYLLPLLLILWANFHIQFLYGLFVPGVLALAASLEAWARRRRLAGWFRATESENFGIPFLWIICFACLAASLINPYGAGVYRTIVAYTKSSLTYDVVRELQPLNFRDSAHYLELMLMAAAFFALGRRGADLFRLLLLTAVSLVAFRTIRDSWFLCITAAVMMADALSKPLEDFQHRWEIGERPVIGPLWMSAAVAGAVCLVLVSAADARFNSNTMAEIVQNSFPEDAAKFIEQSRPPGPLYNNFNWGGYLIAALPDYPVSIDGRNDLYGDETLARAIQTMVGSKWEEDPDLRRANLVLLPIHVPLTGALERSPEFRLIYADKIAKVFARVSN